jgi:hypothetical protein
LPEAAALITGASPSALPAPNDLPPNTAPILERALDTSAIDEIRNLMNKSLQVADLKTWIETHNASTSAKFKKGISSTPHMYKC